MLLDFFHKHLPPNDALRLSSIFTPVTYQKRDFLCRQDAFCSRLGIIEIGLTRSYFINQSGDEVTVCFSSEGMAVFDPVSYYGQKKARFYIQCLEDCVIHSTDRHQLEEVYLSSPHLNRFGRQVLEESYVFMINRIIDHQTMTAEERYQQLLGQAIIMQRIPQKYIASYLGITESSLSRIRRKITP